MTDKFRPVTKAEFDAWIEQNKPHLTASTVHFCEPAMTIYCDDRIPTPSDEGWSKIVARISHFESYPKEREGQVYGWAPNAYSLLEDAR